MVLTYIWGYSWSSKQNSPFKESFGKELFYGFFFFGLLSLYFADSV